ncbi:hypothetical protein D3C80_1965400 [compost metagenome]
MAKIVLPEFKIDRFVLCLYDYNEKVDTNTLQRFSSYAESHSANYEGWKSDEETKKEHYPPGFLEKLKAKEKELLKRI